MSGRQPSANRRRPLLNVSQSDITRILYSTSAEARLGVPLPVAAISRFSEMICRKQGATPLQYQVMLHVRGFPGRDWVTVGEIAERLQAQPYGALAAILRCEANGRVYRTRSTANRRQIEIRLRPKGERCLKKLAALHHAELKWIRKTIQIACLTAAMQNENRLRL